MHAIWFSLRIWEVLAPNAHIVYFAHHGYMYLLPCVTPKSWNLGSNKNGVRLQLLSLLTLFQASKDYLDLVQSQGRRWRNVLQREHDERLALQYMVEHLAKQHRTLEHQARSFVDHAPNTPSGVKHAISGREWFDLSINLWSEQSGSVQLIISNIVIVW